MKRDALRHLPYSAMITRVQGPTDQTLCSGSVIVLLGGLIINCLFSSTLQTMDAWLLTILKGMAVA